MTLKDASSFNVQFVGAHPVFNFNLLPAEHPFDRLKVPTAVAIHRRTLEAAGAWLRQELADPSADVIYAHVNLPHLPLVTERPASLQPFVMSEQGYLTQFGAVDAVVSQVLGSTTRPTQLIVISDHNARPLFPRDQHEHVVFVRWRSWSPQGRTLPVQENAADLVADMSTHPDRP